MARQDDSARYLEAHGSSLPQWISAVKPYYAIRAPQTVHGMRPNLRSRRPIARRRRGALLSGEGAVPRDGFGIADAIAIVARRFAHFEAEHPGERGRTFK